MKKIFILDTNVLLHDPKAILAFQDNEVVLPLVVLDELDRKKVGHDEVARNARAVIRLLDEMRILGSIHEGVKTAAGGSIRVELNHKDQVPSDLDPNRADNRIISVALGIKKEHPDLKVILVSKDINLRVKCDALDVYSEDYNTDSVASNTNDIYPGVVNFEVSQGEIDTIHREHEIYSDFKNLHANQYVHLKSEINPKNTALARYDVEHNKLVKIQPRSNIWNISPRNMEQALAFDALFNPNIKLVTMIGQAGCGKTLLAAAAGISQLYDEKIYKKVIMTRPIVPMGRDLGYLPGDINDKMRPWMAPLQDNLDLIFSEKGKSYLDLEMDRGNIEVEALTYIRGRSIPNSYIIVDEAQNLTRHEIKTIVTRIGEGSKIILTGDILQIDNPFIDSLDNGLSFMVEKFKNEPIAAHITLQKGERSELATKAAELL